MKYLALVVVFLLTASCQNRDQFLETPSFFEKPRYSKTYKLDTSTSETYAVDVDILWVIDNSGSMDTYQRAVIKNSATFISQFTASSRLHWKMGLISTSYREYPYMGFDQVVDYQTPNAVDKFNYAVSRLGTNGDGLAERTFEPVAKVLRNYPNWLRPGAYLIVITVSDELEQSRMSVNEYLDFISGQLNGELARFVQYGVYGPDSNDGSNQKYDEIVQRTNGKIYQINSPDYGVLLAELGKDLVQRTTAVHPIIMLDQKPIIGTIEVTYRGRQLKAGVDWIYNPTYNFIQIQNPKIIDNSFLNVDVSFLVE